VCAEAGAIAQGARLRISLEQGIVEDLASGKRHPFQAIPSHLMAMLNDGGLLGHLEKRLRGGGLAKRP
jgi:3-isopropylmalate/(R)-2-methylmalate dehydratase small subunit